MAEEKELRKMNRTELIEIIYALKKEEEEVNQKLEEAEQQLQNRTIQIAKAGSIAEAAMELNHVFASAQKAADEYLNSVHAVNEEAEQYAKRIRKEAEEEALAIRAKTEEETELLRKQTEIAVHAEMEKMKMTCQEMLAAAVQKQKETEEACQRMAEEAEQERKQNGMRLRKNAELICGSTRNLQHCCRVWKRTREEIHETAKDGKNKNSVDAGNQPGTKPAAVSESVSGGSAEHDLFACSCCGCCSSSCDAVFSGSSGFGNQYGTDTFRPGYSVAGEKRSL